MIISGITHPNLCGTQIQRTNISDNKNFVPKKQLSCDSVHFGSLNMLKHSTLNYEGCLLGGAIGDAFGAPIEMLPLREIERRFSGKLKYLIKQKDGIANITDDTQMTLFTIEGLLKSFNKYKEDGIEFYNNILDSYKNWYKTQVLNAPIEDAKGLMKKEELYVRRAPGNTCLSALQSDKFGSIDKRINSSAGSGGVMRVAPVGLLYWKDAQKAFDIGSKIAALTHGSERGFLPAGFLSSLLANIVQGKNLNEAIDSSLSLLKRYPMSADIADKINLAIEMSKNSLISENEAINKIGLGWNGDEALAIALYSNLKNENSFKNVIISAANHNGDSDTTASIAGNIAGLLYGAESIPNQWKKSVEMNNLLTKYADFLYYVSK